ncbi:hypothetical protein ACFQX7_06680 [Luedemannella flava]
MVRELTDRVLGTVSSGLAGYGSFKQVGVQLDRDGNLKFDKDAFAKAYAADPLPPSVARPAWARR